MTSVETSCDGKGLLLSEFEPGLLIKAELLGDLHSQHG